MAPSQLWRKSWGWVGQVIGSPGRAGLAVRVPTWCVESCLKLSVEEVPDDGPVVLILGQPAATGKSHALSKRGSVHFHPVYKPAWGLAWRWERERGGRGRERGERERAH